VRKLSELGNEELRDIIPELDLERILKNPTKSEMLEELDEVIVPLNKIQ